MIDPPFSAGDKRPPPRLLDETARLFEFRHRCRLTGDPATGPATSIAMMSAPSSPSQTQCAGPGLARHR
jgi:hypothetical protein